MTALSHAQAAHHDELGGHAQKAEDSLNEAAKEVRAAIEYANGAAASLRAASPRNSSAASSGRALAGGSAGVCATSQEVAQRARVPRVPARDDAGFGIR